MPSGRTHDLITVVTAAAATPAVLNTRLPDMGPPNAMVLLGAYLVSGILFSPDLDLHSTPYRRWRKLRWMWLPYRRLVPHRSWISHSMVVGPFLRIVYFVVMLSLLTLAALALLNLFVPVDPTGTLFKTANTVTHWIQAHPATVAYALAGFVLGAAAHTLTDTIVTAVKRRA